MFKKKVIDLSRLGDDRRETVIAATTSFTGVIKSDGLITINGRVEGEIETAGSIIVGKSGQVRASMAAQNVAVAGAVVGNIVAAERLEIGPTGKVLGDIVAATLVIDDGGFFHGHSTMKDPEVRVRETAEEPVPGAV